MYCKDSIHFKEPLSNTIGTFQTPFNLFDVDILEGVNI